MSHQLTHEQAAAVSGFTGGGHLRVVAYAGAGKTSTIVAMARAAPVRRGLYIAFNKAIASDAGSRFPITVNCRTAHSLAYRAVIQLGHSDEQMRTAVRATGVCAVRTYGGISVQAAAQLVTGTIRRFCQSADDAPHGGHVPRPRRPMEDADWREQRAATVAAATQLWNAMIDPAHSTPLGHDGYVKLWQMTHPELAADTVFVDEAQDLNPVLIDVIQRNAARGRQVVSVGDSHQQIYSWRGAVDALQQLPGDEYRLTQSFRFGDNIARFANRLLAAMGETIPLLGNGRSDDLVGPSDGLASAVLCRTNSGVVINAAMLIDSGCQVYVPGGAGELLSLVEDAERLQQGQPARTADLLGFNRWREVVEHAETGDGADLRTFVGLVEKHGCRELRRVLGQVLPCPAPGAVTISTAHRAKGLEWDDVELYEDFTVQGHEIDMEERRLFYVAATRARRELMVSDELVRAYTDVG